MTSQPVAPVQIPNPAFIESMAEAYALLAWGSWRSWPEGDRALMIERFTSAYITAQSKVKP